MELIFAFILLGGVGGLAIRLWLRLRAMRATYAPIIDAHEEIQRSTAEANRVRATAQRESDELREVTRAEVERLRSDTRAAIEAATSRLESEVDAIRNQRDALRSSYATARATFDRLRVEVALLEENVEDISVGLYKPHYSYPSSVEYKSELDLIWKSQQALIKMGRAVVAGQQWEVQGDRRAGERMMKQYLKLMLRAFNGECDAAIAKVAWNNVTKMQERIHRSFTAINELGSVMQMQISSDYLQLKLSELRLEYEYAEKKRAEQEEQRSIRDQMRQEERARREAERAVKDAEEEEARNERALERAKAELASARGEALEQLQLRIKHLDEALHKAHERKDRASSMAQLTRSGYVYIVSNVGTFGDDVFKIGMTRRLDPMDRIWELSDASVPFDFDVHAMVYSEDAPSLEGAFHSRFRDRALNLVNPRKEFFAVSLAEIESVAEEQQLRVELTRMAEAKEFRQSQAIRAARANGGASAPTSAPSFPDSI